MVSILFRSRKHPHHILAKLSMENFYEETSLPTIFSCTHHLPWLVCHAQRLQNPLKYVCGVCTTNSLRIGLCNSSAHTSPLILMTGHGFWDLSQNWGCEVKRLAHCFPRSKDSPQSWDDLTREPPKPGSLSRCWRQTCLIPVGRNKEATGWLFCLFVRKNRAHALGLRFLTMFAKYTRHSNAFILLLPLSFETDPPCCPTQVKVNQRGNWPRMAGKINTKPTSFHTRASRETPGEGESQRD